MWSWVKAILSALIVLSLLLSAGYLSGEQVSAADSDGQGLPPIELPEKGNPKLDSQLNRLSSAVSPQKALSFAQQSSIEMVNDRVRVVVESLPGQVDAVAKSAAALGVVETSYGNLLQL